MFYYEEPGKGPGNPVTYLGNISDPVLGPPATVVDPVDTILVKESDTWRIKDEGSCSRLAVKPLPTRYSRIVDRSNPEKLPRRFAGGAVVGALCGLVAGMISLAFGIVVAVLENLDVLIVPVTAVAITLNLALFAGILTSKIISEMLRVSTALGMTTAMIAGAFLVVFLFYAGLSLAYRI